MSSSDFPPEDKITDFFPEGSAFISYGGYIKILRDENVFITPFPVNEMNFIQVGRDLIFDTEPEKLFTVDTLKIWVKYTKSDTTITDISPVSAGGGAAPAPAGPGGLAAGIGLPQPLSSGD
ncbi:hypothetical protein FACS189472_15590 [Alphaproteobacteria bacterium]|nr:hypothetical protein FACS189472_15590 [Alphaproteobacteria bacterium]